MLLGDHKQLPPCSLVPPQDLKGTGHDRSMLERCVLASGQAGLRSSIPFHFTHHVYSSSSARPFNSSISFIMFSKPLLDRRLDRRLNLHAYAPRPYEPPLISLFKAGNT